MSYILVEKTNIESVIYTRVQRLAKIWNDHYSQMRKIQVEDQGRNKREDRVNGNKIKV